MENVFGLAHFQRKNRRGDMKKFYFDKDSDDESCYRIGHFQNERKEKDEDIILEEAKVERGSEYFYCKEFHEAGMVGDGCGKECKRYQPRNGKNGRCRFSGPVYTGSGKIFRLTKELKLIKIVQ